MKEKIITWLFLILCIVGVGISGWTYTKKDRTAPVITLSEKELSIRDVKNERNLLDGVTAMDDVDGDVSDSLIIEGVYSDNDGHEYVVRYAAEDSSGNVAKTEKRVTRKKS